MSKKLFTCLLEELTVDDVAIAGGKNASLGEMLGHLKNKGVRVPPGFAVTAEGYRFFLKENGLAVNISELLSDMQPTPESIQKVGKEIRTLLLSAELPKQLKEEICLAYKNLSSDNEQKSLDVAVRSSATAEDLPNASFAGQQETFLHIKGQKALLDACKKCFASLFTDRAISYREEQGFKHLDVALSIGVQKMVRSDLASAGVMFTLDPETGFDRVIVINSIWGLGENIVGGVVTPDEFLVYKPFLDRKEITPIIEKKMGSKELKLVYQKGKKEETHNKKTTKLERRSYSLNDQDVLELSLWGKIIEEHYQRPMDIEWAKDGLNGPLYIVQARPETVQSQKTKNSFKTYHLKKKGKILTRGLAIGEMIASGEVQVIKDVKDIDSFKEGAILVTEMTDPDWVPIMKLAKGIITNQGGRTSHAAIVSRELGVTAIVGTTNATEVLAQEKEVTLSCAEGSEGFIYQGILPFEEEEMFLKNIPKTRTKVMLNIANPSAAFRWWRLPVDGVGLARMEFIINEGIQIHPMALAHFEQVKNQKERKKILKLTENFENKADYFVTHLASGIAKIASVYYPFPTIVRMSDFKTNEYAHLIGGKEFEAIEENPMIGFRGASRYYSPKYEPGFELECRAIKKVREELGFDQVIMMIPFCRTLEEAAKVLEICGKYGLKRGERGLKMYMMAEIPSNIILANEFSKLFDGFSIGSNDLTQLTLGIDRDAADLAEIFDENNPAIILQIKSLIEEAHKKNLPVGICGQGPSDSKSFAEKLVRMGIDSISLNPDSVLKTIQTIAQIEAESDDAPRV